MATERALSPETGIGRADGRAPAPVPRPAPRLEVARLAALHREAAETAHLANLLGRAPYAMTVLALSAAAVAASAFDAVPAARIASWLVLMLGGVAALARAYAQTIRAPFERAPLQAFAKDLDAILTYCGFAWGAGAFLALPASAGALAGFAFAVLPPALIVVLLRTRATALVFVAPAAALSAFALALRPQPGGVLTAAFAILGAGAVAGAALWLDRQDPRGGSLARAAGLPFG